MANVNVNKCLDNIKLNISLHKCASSFELSSISSILGIDKSHDKFHIEGQKSYTDITWTEVIDKSDKQKIILKIKQIDIYKNGQKGK